MSEYERYIPALKCGNCGAAIDLKSNKCGSCGSTLYIDDIGNNVARFERYAVQDLIGSLNAMIPNGNAIVDGKGGIGWIVCNHRISVHYKSEIPITKAALLKALSVLQMEGCTADLMIVNPIQMYEIMLIEKLTGPNVEFGVVGFLFGMAVLVSRFQPAGIVLIMDTKQYDKRYDERAEGNTDKNREPRDTLVSLNNGVTSLITTGSDVK